MTICFGEQLVKRIAIVGKSGIIGGDKKAATEVREIENADYLKATDPLFMDKVHPTVKGNKVLAQTIFDGLGDLLPEGTRFDQGRIELDEAETAAERGWNLRRRPWTELLSKSMPTDE